MDVQGQLDLYARVMKLREIFPEAQVAVDEYDSQIIIYTGENYDDAT